MLPTIVTPCEHLSLTDAAHMLAAYSIIGAWNKCCSSGVVAVSVHSLGVACQVRGGVAYQGLSYM